MRAIRQLQSHSNTEKSEVKLDTGNLDGVPENMSDLVGEDVVENRVYKAETPCSICCATFVVYFIIGVCMGLVGSSLTLLARFSDFGGPEHAPRSPAGTSTCTVVYTRVHSVPRSREREKRPAAGR